MCGVLQWEGGAEGRRDGGSWGEGEDSRGEMARGRGEERERIAGKRRGEGEEVERGRGVERERD